MILKILIIAAVIGVVYTMFFKTRANETDNTKQKPKKPEVNEMVECANCHLYVEVKESILSNGKYYCSRECLKEAN